VKSARPLFLTDPTDLIDLIDLITAA